MSNELKFYINGQWVDPVKPATLDVINPATEEAYVKISVGSPADVEKAVAAGDKAKASDAFKIAQSVIDSIADKGIFHKNKAARHKSRLSAKIKAIAA